MGDLTDSIGYNIFFENNVTFQEKYRFRNRLTLDAEELEKCESIFSQMLREQTIRSSGCRAMNEALFMELCVLICRAFSRAERKSLSEISNLSRLLEFMKRHYMEELPLPELARRGHCSVSSLCRLFRSALGRSPGEYLNTLRLERAAKELRETEKSISAIAFFLRISGQQLLFIPLFAAFRLFSAGIPQNLFGQPLRAQILRPGKSPPRFRGSALCRRIRKDGILPGPRILLQEPGDPILSNLLRGTGSLAGQVLSSFDPPRRSCF